MVCQTGPVPRRTKKHIRAGRPLSSGHASEDVKVDGAFNVRTVSGAAAVKSYRCPGCGQIVRPGQAHLVSWPKIPDLISTSGLDERRHWHTSCWQRRR